MFDEAILIEKYFERGQLDEDVFLHFRALIQDEPNLSFIFSLGNHPQYLCQQCRRMLDAALSQQISCLDDNAAKALVTEPIAPFYAFDSKAIDQLLSYTSCHPYFTQSLCHELFVRWTKLHFQQATADDVRAVLDTTISKVAHNLQFIWEDSSDAEKIILSALAEKGADLNVNRRLARFGIHLKSDNIASALMELARREVIISQAFPSFRVSLVHRWLALEKPLEWVCDELKIERVEDFSSRFRSSNLYGDLVDILLRIEWFNSDRLLRTLFSDTRVNMWQNIFPEANSRFNRVETVVDFLSIHYSGGENGLIVNLHPTMYQSFTAKMYHLLTCRSVWGTAP